MGLTLSEMNRRFVENSDILLALDSVYEFDPVKLKSFERIGIKIPDDNELKFVKKHMEAAKKEVDVEPFNHLKALFPHRKTFEDTYRLLEVVDVFGCSTAVCESSFSTFNRIDVVERISMTCDRLKDLAFPAFEHKRLGKIDNISVMKIFNSDKNRRVLLF